MTNKRFGIEYGVEGNADPENRNYDFIIVRDSKDDVLEVITRKHACMESYSIIDEDADGLGLTIKIRLTRAVLSQR